MDWLGIGVLIIGIAFAVLVVVLIKPLNKAAELLEGVKQTTDKLPKMVDDLSGQTTEVMHSSNQTIANVNDQVKEISPLFHLVGDIGEQMREKTQAALTKTSTLKTHTEHAADFTKREKYEGIYGLLSFIYFMRSKKNASKKTIH